jgi:hypothetical protein
MPSPLLAYARLWFAARLLLALFPPLRWAARGPDAILAWPVGNPWAYGLTTDADGLLVNLFVYLLAAVLLPHTSPEQARLDALFGTSSQPAAADLAYGEQS